MSTLTLHTPRLSLVLGTPEEMHAMLDSMSPEHRQQVSDEWLAMVRAASEPSPWVHGFKMMQRESESHIGDCGFKGPPAAEAMVEIAYAVEEQFPRTGIRHRSGYGIDPIRIRTGGSVAGTSAYLARGKCFDARAHQVRLCEDRRGDRSRRWSRLAVGKAQRTLSLLRHQTPVYWLVSQRFCAGDHRRGRP